MNKKRRHEHFVFTLCALMVVLILAGFPSQSFGNDAGFSVIKVETDWSAEKGKNSELVKDFYLAGGEDDGLSEAMVLDVYRDTIIRNEHKESDFTISILVGQVKVFKLFKNVAAVRIISLASSDKNPVLEYRTVMIGDYAVPPRINAVSSKDSRPSKVNITPAGKGELKSADPGVMLPSEVLFEFNDWKLKPKAADALAAVQEMFNRAKDKDIRIEGHTCSVGTDEYNLELSNKRAQSVADYFINTVGISKDNIHIQYHGEKFPVASNDTKKGRIKNRRVEIHFINRESKQS
jgi:outer membrane protein OmpA-like peptidoglycan-associated protein